MGKRKPPDKLPCKPPSRRKRAKWAKLIELCTARIISWPSHAVTMKVPDIQITWAKKPDGTLDIPKDWPRSMALRKHVHTGTSMTASYNCEVLLDYFYARHYIDYFTGTLYEQRLPVMMMLAKSELKLDNMLDID